MNRFLVCLVVIVGAVLGKDQAFECPKKEGQFLHPTQCDKYYVCAKGVAKERLCPDGLVFNENIKLDEKCDRVFNVDCSNRTEMQKPKGTKKECPRRNGAYAHPNRGICNIYYSCIEDDPVQQMCTTGLYFNEESGNCEWPHSANREGCKTAEELRVESGSDEFTCPSETVKDVNGQVVPHPKYAHPTDCQKFFLCINGIERRELSCDKGKVFSEEKFQCDDPANVEGCEDWETVDPQNPYGDR